MTPYSSKSGKNSGVIAYENGNDYILVQFSNRKKYKYTYTTAGPDAVEQMKKYALKGEKLSTYISQYDPGFE